MRDRTQPPATYIKKYMVIGNPDNYISYLSYKWKDYDFELQPMISVGLDNADTMNLMYDIERLLVFTSKVLANRVIHEDLLGCIKALAYELLNISMLINIRRLYKEPSCFFLLEALEDILGMNYIGIFDNKRRQNTKISNKVHTCSIFRKPQSGKTMNFIQATYQGITFRSAMYDSKRLYAFIERQYQMLIGLYNRTSLKQLIVNHYFSDVLKFTKPSKREKLLARLKKRFNYYAYVKGSRGIERPYQIKQAVDRSTGRAEQGGRYKKTVITPNNRGQDEGQAFRIHLKRRTHPERKAAVSRRTNERHTAKLQAYWNRIRGRGKDTPGGIEEIQGTTLVAGIDTGTGGTPA